MWLLFIQGCAFSNIQFIEHRRHLAFTAPTYQDGSGPDASHQTLVKDWNLGRLNHVAIAVSDLPKAIALYRDILGADVSDVMVTFKLSLAILLIKACIN